MADYIYRLVRKHTTAQQDSQCLPLTELTILKHWLWSPIPLHCLDRPYNSLLNVAAQAFAATGLLTEQGSGTAPGRISIQLFMTEEAQQKVRSTTTVDNSTLSSQAFRWTGLTQQKENAD